jgi:hypothetical protein
MPLSAVNFVPQGPIKSADLIQFFNLFTGTMTDQPVTFKNTLTVGGNQGVSSAPLRVQGVSAQTANFVEVRLLAADAQPAFIVNPTGTLGWGPGGGTAVDATLSRSGVGILTVSGAGAAVAQFNGVSAAVNYLNIGNAITGNSPFIQALGADGNVAARIISKGTAGVQIEGGTGIILLAAPAGGTPVNYLQIQNAITTGQPSVYAVGADPNISLNIGTKGIGNVNFSGGGGGTQMLVLSPVASAVNSVQIISSATGNPSIVTVQGTDANIQLSLQSKGTAGVALQSGTGLNILLAAPIANAVNYIQLTNAVTGNQPQFSAQGNDANIAMSLAAKGLGSINFNAGALPVIVFSPVASAVNYFQVVAAATGNSPYIQALGADANIAARLISKGTAGVQLEGPGGVLIFGAAPVGASAVNYIQVANAATGVSPSLTAVGTDATIHLTLTPKGGAAGKVINTGAALVCGAGSSLGFFEASGDAPKQTVVGSRSANTALANLLTALAAYGLITDGTGV